MYPVSIFEPCWGVWLWIGSLNLTLFGMFFYCWNYVTFYPRSILAFGFCRSLRLCVCVCLSVCINHKLVNTITRHPLTHWGRDKMASISQTTFSNAFTWMKMYELRLKIHWSLFLRVHLTIFQHWFRKWLGAVQATSHYLNQWWLVYQRIYASLGLNELRLEPPNTARKFKTAS